MQRRSSVFFAAILLNILLVLILSLFLSALFLVRPGPTTLASSPGPASAAFTQAAREFGVPAPLLEAICYMEGRLSNHNGSPSMDNGFGCMHLVQNRHGN